MTVSWEGIICFLTQALDLFDAHFTLRAPRVWHAALYACRAGKDAARARALVAAAPDRVVDAAVLGDAAAVCVAAADYDGAADLWTVAAARGLARPELPADDGKIVTVDVHGLTAPLAVGAVVAAARARAALAASDRAPALVVLTGASGVLKPKLATHVTADLGLWLGDEPTTHGGVLVVPGAAVRAFNDRTAAAAAAASPAGAPL